MQVNRHFIGTDEAMSKAIIIKYFIILSRVTSQKKVNFIGTSNSWFYVR